MEKISNEKNRLFVRRSSAIAVLVRLEIVDIPIPHSKECRKKMIEYLANILSDSIDLEDNKYIEINYENMGLEGEDLKSAIEILNNYRMVWC